MKARVDTSRKLTSVEGVGFRLQIMAMIPLEDNFEDVLGKAMRGMSLDADTLSFLSGVETSQIESLMDGEFNEGASRKVAGTLGLDGETLVERGQEKWAPRDFELEGLRQYNTPHADMTVNSYLIWDPNTMDAAIFDTGTNLDEAYSHIQALGLTVKQLFLTHTHVDHIEALPQALKWGGITVRISAKEAIEGAEKFTAGDEFQIGHLKVSTRSTWGHSPGATTYVVEGLEKPVAIVGDALFAQSMGGGVVSYQAALETNRKEIFSLTDETVICPGHGPMSTVGEEKAHNPFYPEFK
jgi:glyoxylase-like metal-dependent hydrolase (beta-lactamase superfamily II)